MPRKPSDQTPTANNEQPVHAPDVPETAPTPTTETLSLMVELQVPLAIDEGYNDARSPKPSLNAENARKLKQITLALIEQKATVTCGGDQFNSTTGDRPRKLVQRPQDALAWLIEQAQVTPAA